MTGESFDYDSGLPHDIRPAGSRTNDVSTTTEFTYATPYDRRRAAALVRPHGDGPFPATLYVHWYEPAAADSNRTQFLEEAEAMAARGAASLLIETIWSDRDWFLKRTQAEDRRMSIEQVVELRCVLDLLLDRPDIDAKRLAYVGHDFGAMYGVVLGSVDPRPACYVLMAGTPRFPDWFLYYPQLEGEARTSFEREMSDLDPIGRVPDLAPAPLLFQFGRSDPHVPVERAEAFFQAAADPMALIWYDAGHGLNEQAQADRMQWVARQLDLSSL